MSTTPLTPSQWLAVQRAEGIDIQQYRSWATHERDDETGKVFGPVHGITIHHTAGRDSIALCYNGTSSLPGPLCHTHLSKTGVANMLSAGRANHAGTFARNAHNAVLNESSVHPHPDASEPVDGNDSYYGIEIENLGNGTDPYPWVQYRTAVKWATAICRHHGWTADRVIGHKEGTRRKIDPKGPVYGPDGKVFDFTMNRFRADVKAALALPAGQWQGGAQQPPQEDELTPDDIFNADKVPAQEPPYENDDWHSGNQFWTFKYAVYTIVRAGREALSKLDALPLKLWAYKGSNETKDAYGYLLDTARDVREMKVKVAALENGGVDLDDLADRVVAKMAERLAE